MYSEDHEDEDSAKFDRFKTDFFQAMSKMSKMQEVAEVLELDGPEKGSKLAASIRDSIKFVEESAYAKLV